VGTDRAAGLESSRSDAARGGPNIRLPLGPGGSSVGPSAKPPATGAQDYIPWQSTTDTLRFFDVASNNEQSPLTPLPSLTALPHVVWSHDVVGTLRVPSQTSSPNRSNVLASASNDGRLWIWDMKSHHLLAQLFLDERIRKEIDATRSRFLALVPQDALAGAAAAPLLAFSPDGAQLAVCDGKEAVRIWETSGWHELPPLAGRHAQSTGQHAQSKVLVYSPDGSTLAVNDCGQIKLYDPRTAAFIAAIGTEGALDICCGRFSPDGRVLAIGTAGGSVRFVDVASRRLGTTLVGHGDAVVSLDFSRDGRTLATGSWDTTVRLWDVTSNREVAVLEGHRGRVHAVAFSPDGTVLASGGEIDDSPEQGLGELFLWRTARGSQHAARAAGSESR
jgi:WD40 repeat protein